MSRPEALESMTAVKQGIAGAIHAVLAGVDGVCSVTLVGSFVDREDLAGISDIDTVVVFDRLTPARFVEAVSAVSALSGDALGLAGRKVRVNATLGPLKHDSAGEIVIHLMLYDRASHRQHVLHSPFTCLDWERSPVCWGVRLAELFPVGCLEPGDFPAARRGLANYVADLASGTLSFRRFEPDGDAMIEVADRITLDRRHQGEYAYHIVRNLVVNALKMRTGRNEAWDESGLRRDWLAYLPDLAEWIPFYDHLRAVKITREDGFPAGTVARTREFLDAFQTALDRVMAGAFRLRLVRHARTALNDGTFLGTGRDPSIAEPEDIEAHADDYEFVYSSPSRRALETARSLAPGASIQIDPRLSEINYGQAEGLTPEELRERFPATVEGWEHGDDVPFPGGERTADVLHRARAFLGALDPGSGRALAVSHNVVMRVIVADLLGLDLRRAHCIPIAHLEPLDICRVDGRWLPNWGAAVKARIIDGFMGWPTR
jgi:broad specificity phosphatase PhoE/predicted nucleotidyltransferase